MALCDSYGAGLMEATRGTFPTSAVVMGIVSNGGAGIIILLLYGAGWPIIKRCSAVHLSHTGCLRKTDHVSSPPRPAFNLVEVRQGAYTSG
jgi:hypothetical protein